MIALSKDQAIGGEGGVWFMSNLGGQGERGNRRGQRQSGRQEHHHLLAQTCDQKLEANTTKSHKIRTEA
jgi:hypothetical protein